jgi:uncharacterized protein
MLTSEKIKQAVDLVVKAANPEQVILFGSYARGTANDESDIDLCVIKKELQDRRSEAVRLRRVISPLRIPVDIIVHSTMTFNEWAAVPGTIMNVILSEGKVVYEKQP